MDNIFRLSAFILVTIGALNWGLVGLFEFNLVTCLFGSGYLSRIIYFVVAASAAYLVAQIFLNEGILKIR